MSATLERSLPIQDEFSPVPASAEPMQHPCEPTPSVTPHNAPRQLRQTEQAPQGRHQHREEQTEEEEEDDDDDEWLVACRCENSKELLTLLSCLQHISESHRASDATGTQNQTQTSSSRRSKTHQIQPVTVFCSPSRFTFHVFGPAKQSEASIELQKAMFTQYQVLQGSSHHNGQDDWQAGGEFCVNLTTVLESLQLLGSLDRTKILMTYNLQQEIFKMELLQDDTGVICTAAIPGLMSPEDSDGDSLSSAFRSAPLAVRMMVRSGILRELLPEWSNVAGASCVSVGISQSKGLEIAVLGHYGECWVQVPPKGDHMVSPLELADPRKSVTRTYPLHSLLSGMKGLEIAEETCININADGIMAIQHKTIDPTGNGCSNFVDFIMTCLEENEEEEEEEGESDAETRIRSSASQGTRLTWDQQTEQSANGNRGRRPQPQKNPIQEDGEDDVVQGSTDTEDGADVDADTPRSRQKRHSRLRRPAAATEEKKEEEDEGGDPPPISVGPLFGTVVREPPATSGTTPPRRRQRRYPQSSVQGSGQRKRNKGKDEKRHRSRQGDQDSDASKNWLANSSDEEEHEGAASSEDEEETLDIPALAGTPIARRHEECSSPEVVYGKQM